MAGIGAEGALGAAGTFAGLQDWMRQRRQQVVEGQQDTLFQQGQEDRATGQAQEAALARQKLVDQQTAQQDQAEMLAQLEALDLPPLAKLGAKISLKQGKPLPNELLALLKPRETKLTIAPNGQAVDLGDPSVAGQNFGAPEKPAGPKLQFAPDGRVVDMSDPSLVGQRFVAPKAPPSEAAGLAAEMARLRIDAERQKQADAAAGKVKEADTAKQSATDAIATIDRLLAHPGLAASTGAYEMRGWTQPAQDFRAELDRFVAQQTKGNLGSLKGPMSDKDIAFIKAMSTTAANTKLSDEALIAELKRARAAYAGENGTGGAAPLTRTQRNRRTGETRTQTSTDGGKTWQ